MTTYSDSKPMIDGVRMRLCVTVWNATVAVAWQNATTSMTARLLTRISAMSQKPREPKGIGLPHARLAVAKPMAISARTAKMIQYRLRARAVGNGPVPGRESAPEPARFFSGVASAVSNSSMPDTSENSAKASSGRSGVVRSMAVLMVRSSLYRRLMRGGAGAAAG